MPKRVWNKDKILAELHRVRVNGPRRDLRLDAAAKKHFGSLREALRIAGLPCGSKPPPYSNWTRESVIQAIRRRHREGKSLGSTHREEPSLYASGKRLFGSWLQARVAAGLPSHLPEFYTADEVRLMIIELYEKELPLVFRSHNDEKLRRSAKKHFGGWRRAVESLGLGSEMKRKWTKESIIDAILYRRAAGHSLYRTVYDDKPLFYAAVNHFGNWQAALSAAGIQSRVLQRWSKELVVERLRELSKKYPGQNVRKLDTNLAAVAYRLFGSLGNALEAAGIQSQDKSWSKERIIAVIRDRYEAGECKRLAGFGDRWLAHIAWRHFGSWAAAVEAAGMTDVIRPNTPAKRWSRQEVLDALAQCKKIGRPYEELVKEYPGIVRAACTRFGRWRLALEAVGLECKRREWSRNRIVQEIKSRQVEGKSLASSDPNNVNMVAASARHFGSWRAALRAAGVNGTSQKASKPR